MTRRIEFCGVPASGKSTLCSGALDLLKKNGVAVLGRDEVVSRGLRKRNFGRLANTLGALLPGWRKNVLGLPHSLNDWHQFVVDHPRFALLCHEWLNETSTDKMWRSAVYYALLTSAFEFRLSEEINELVLLDESFAQRFHSFRGYCSAGHDTDAVDYANTMPRPSALILVDTPAAVCLERLKKRDRKLVLMLAESEDQQLQQLTEGGRRLSNFAAALEQGGTRVLRVNGSGDVEASLATVVAFVESVTRG